MSGFTHPLRWVVLGCVAHLAISVSVINADNGRQIPADSDGKSSWTGRSLMRSERNGAADSSISDISDPKPSGPLKWCTAVGDPHVRTFNHHYWHPMHAPGNWWLVRTKSDLVSVQAQYGECGRHRWNGIGRTCIKALAVSGKFIKDTPAEKATLTVEAACDYDIWKNKCRNKPQKSNLLRVSWNGDPIPVTLNHHVWLNGKIGVQVFSNRVDIDLPYQGKIRMWAWWANRYFNVHMHVRKYAEEYYGHCSSYGKCRYTYDGLARANAPQLCDAAVHCKDRLMHGGQFGSYGRVQKATEKCKENVKGAAFGLSDCPEKKLNVAKEKCKKAFAAKGIHYNSKTKEHFEDCWLDDCGQNGFEKGDAEDEKREEREGAK